MYGGRAFAVRWTEMRRDAAAAGDRPTLKEHHVEGFIGDALSPPSRLNFGDFDEAEIQSRPRTRAGLIGLT
ncbi:uncharacterized protein RAG0_00302 [Rhynchosporium agropyri]|uniref:Uncharacterized protein n=1 Tax=Rhynchosporium agropyri TaxID=914238 RepID=A0A1E1JSG6_9HELO|nr:uncharacterized protein RAG0_00302 [Rhynchosporium agropyri]